MQEDYKIKIEAEVDTTKAEQDLKNFTKNNNNRKVNIDVDKDGNIKKVDENIKNATKSTENFGNTLKKTSKIGASYSIVSEGFHLIREASEKAKDAILNFDSAIKDLRMATGGTYQEISNLIKGYNSLGQELGADTLEVTSGADSWLRQGHSIKDTNILIKDSMILSKVAQLESAESTKYLTSAMKGYEVEADNVIDIVDKLTAVDLVSATDAGGIAEAMSKTAVSANSAGVSIDKLIGYLAATGEVTQENMSVIGNAFKTFFARYSAIKSGKLELVDEDGTVEVLSDVEQSLKNVGINMRTTITDFDNAGDVLDNLSSKWDTLNSTQQNAIASAFGSTRQKERFLVLMENYDKATEYMQTSMNSAGTAEKKFNAYLDSIEAKSKTLQASFEALAINTFDTESVGNIIDATSALITFLDKTNLLKTSLTGVITVGLIKGFTALTTGITNASVKMNNFNQALNLIKSGNIGENELNQLAQMTANLSQSQLKAVLSSKALTAEQRLTILTSQGLSEAEAKALLSTLGLATAEGTATASTFSLKGAFKGLWSTLKANPLILLATTISLVTTAFSAFKQAQEDAKQKISDTATASRDAAETAKEEAQTLQELIEKYKELAKKDNLDSSTRSEIADIQEQINELVGSQATNLDLVNGKLQDQLALLKDINAEAVNNSISSFRTAYNDSRIETGSKELKTGLTYDWLTGKDLTLDYSYFSQLEDDIESKAYEAIENIMANNGYGEAFRGYETYQISFSGLDEYDFDSKINALNEILDKLQEIDGYNTADSKLFKVLSDYKDELKTTYDLQTEQGTALINSLISDFNSHNSDNVNSLDSYLEYRQKLLESLKNDTTVSGMLSENVFDNEKLENTVDTYLSTLDEFSFYYNEWYNKLGSETAKGILQIKQDFGKVNASVPPQSNEGGLQGVNDFNNWIANLSSADKEIVYTISCDTDTAHYSLQKWQDALDNYKKENNVDEESNFTKLMNEKGTDENPVFVERVDTYIEKINTLKEALSKFQSGEFENADLVKLTKDFPELANHADDLNVAISNLIDELSTDMSSDFKSQFGNMKTVEDIKALQAYEKAVLGVSKNITAAKINSTSVISELDNISSAYNTVFDSITEYTETGNLTANTFKVLIQLEPKYINSLVTENGQLQLNKESYVELTKAQLENYKISKALEEINLVKGLQTIEEANKYVASLNIESVETMADALDSQWQQLYMEAQLKDAAQGTTAFTDAVLNSYQYLQKNNSIVDAYSESLENNTDVVFGATEATDNYKDALEKQKEIQEKNKEVLEDNKSAIEDLIDLTEDYIKQIKEDEKEALEERKEAIQNEIDATIELLDKEKERAKIADELTEKQNNLSKANLSLISASLDDSSAGKKNYKEAQDEYNDANSEMTEFLTDRKYDIQKEALENYKTSQEEYYDGLISTIDEYLDNEVQLYKDACDMIDNDNGTLYNNLLSYIQTYTTTTNAEFNYLWDNAQTALTQYNDLHYSTFGLMDYLQGCIYTTESVIEDYEAQIDDVGSAIGGVATNINGVSTSINNSADALNNFNQKYNEFLKNSNIEYGMSYYVNGEWKPYYSELSNKQSAAQEIARNISKDIGGTHEVPWYAIYGNLQKYARGTKSAVGGLSIVDEEGIGSELIPQSLGGGRYTVLPYGNPVFSKAMTNELFDFSNDPTKYITDLMPQVKDKMLDNIGGVPKVKQTSVANAPNININIQGNADASTVRALRQEADNIVKKATEASMRNIINVVDRNNYVNR